MFLGLAVLVGVSVDDPPWIDERIFRLAQRLQEADVNSFLKFIGRLGGTEVVVPLGLTFAAVVSVKRTSLSPIAIVLAAYGFAAWFTLRFKHLLERPEPFDGPGQIGLSYPSGHLSQATSVYLVLIALAGVFRHRTVIRAVLASMLVIVFTAVVYRSAHWMLDSVGGAALGVCGACVGILVVRALEKLPFVRDLLGALRSRPMAQPVSRD